MRFYRAAYGCDPIERRHLLVILRPWGALAVFAGFAGLITIWHPSVRFGIESALLVLLGLRLGYRIGLRRELRDISGIAPARNLANIAILAAGAALLSADLLRHRNDPW